MKANTTITEILIFLTGMLLCFIYLKSTENPIITGLLLLLSIFLLSFVLVYLKTNNKSKEESNQNNILRKK